MKCARDRVLALLFPTVRNFDVSPTLDDCAKAYDEIADAIGGKCGDPGKLYPIADRVKHVVSNLEAELENCDICDHMSYGDEEQEKETDAIESAISGLPGDPGHLYPLDERVRRVIGALQARARR